MNRASRGWRFVLFICAAIGALPHIVFSQARDTSTRPEGIVKLEEFRSSIADDWRSIYVRTISDSLIGPIRGYADSRFYLEDSTVFDRKFAKSITEYRSCANPGAMYGAAGGVVIGAIILSATILHHQSKATNGDTGGSQALGSALIVGGSLSCALPGALIGLVIGSKFERGYNFPVSSLETE